MDYQKRNRDFADIAVSVGRFLWSATEEIFSGIINNRVPAKMCYAGLLFALGFYFRFDIWVLEKLGIKFRLGGSLRLFLTYASLSSGWFLWGVARAGERGRLLNRLKGAFLAANLRCNGRFPSLIEDVRVDDHVRKLRLLCHGVPKADFEKEIGRLESVLNMTVVRILQDENDKSKLEIVYTMKDLDQNVVLENPGAFADGEIPIGHSHEGAIHINMRDVGHILVAGQTGGGKSNFLKVATTVLTLNNPESNVFFLDFKGGMESADIRNHAKNLGSNVSCIDGAKRSIEFLGVIGADLDSRFKTLSAAGVSNLDDYLKKQIGRKASLNEKRADDICRTFIVVDEIAQLYSRDPEVDKESQNNARAAINRIARQGRAAGIHLIVATQKPDASSFDQTVKSNLPGVLCFPMPNQVSSVSALGTKRAFEINPHIKGRAVWKFGPKLEEVQTYLFG